MWGNVVLKLLIYEKCYNCCIDYDREKHLERVH